MKSVHGLSILLVASLLSFSFARPVQAQATMTIGDTKLESDADSGNGNLVLVQEAKLSESATVSSLSFFVTQAAGDLVLGVYDATGPRGGPGKLLATTQGFATAAGWNTANVVTPVPLAAGNYWLAYLPSSSSLSFLKQNNSGSCFYNGQRFTSGMPATFATSPSSCTATTWSFYATLMPASASASGGACGSSNGGNFTSAPTTNLCSAGTASQVTGTGPWNWTCAGGGGATASCSAQLEIIGSCGSANGVAVSAAPNTNLCAAGSASTVNGTGPWSWNCAGAHGGGTASCSAPLSQPVVNGSCGSANGVAVSKAPTTNLCAAGTASTVAGSGPWAWSCAGSAGGSAASCSAPVASVGGPASPLLIQHVASSANPLGLGIPGNNFRIPLPNSVLEGDALVLAITFPHGGTSAISDTLGQRWPAAAVTEDGGSGNYVTQIYVLCGSAAGTETIQVNLTQSGLPFEYTVSEFNNVATSGCVDGTAGGSNLSASSSGVINPGSFTPRTNNDAKGGHIVWNYDAISSIANGNPSMWVPATGFTLLDGDIAWTNRQGFPHASQWYVQTANAAVSPSITATGDTQDRFNSASVSLLVANSGSTMPSGIHINKIVHESWIALSGGTLTLQLPATGNLRVLAFPAGQGNINITSISSSDGATWHVAQSGGDSAQIWYAANGSPNSSLTVAVHTSGESPTNSARFFDVQGASASPLDVAVGADFVNCSSSSTVANQPTITPTGTNELVIATMAIGQGPGLGLAAGAPSGAVWDLTTYASETDNDLMENADALAHLYSTTTAVEHWNWTITPNGGNSCSSEAVAFK